MNSLHDLVAATIVTGIHATNPAEFAGEVGSTPFGGYILFARNLTSLAQGRALTDAMRNATDRNLPPIIAIDQEGGRVVRLRDDFARIPSAMAMSATGDSDLIRRAGEQCAFDLRRLGANVNFAPVLDLAVFPKNTVIGTRSFGSDPALVAEMAGAFARGLHNGGIVATPKHFPGHGSTIVDSHCELPVITESLERIWDRDLAPFRALLPSCAAVMSAHIVIEALRDPRPVTLNGPFLQAWLRERCGFRGVLFSDALEMQAIGAEFGVVEGAVLALQAGVDALLIAQGAAEAREILSGIVGAVQEGRIPIERLHEAVARLRTLRETLWVPIAADAQSPYAGIGEEIARRAVTLVRGDPVASNAYVIEFTGEINDGAVDLRNTLGTSIRTQWQGGLQPEAAEVEKLIASLESIRERVVVLMRRAHMHEQQQDAIQRILDHKPDALIVSLLEPSDAFIFPDARHVLCTYGDDEVLLKALHNVLCGREEAIGHLRLDWDPQ